MIFINYSYGHIVFNNDVENSLVCGTVKILEKGFCEWQVRHRYGLFNLETSKYTPCLLRCGYAKNRELALRNIIDYIKSGVWQ